ncbi:MAG TPA: hypothetical protein VFE41_16425 [Acetobacteraceae bacterium]|jgi:hypothetical protein|nr:hypothetical protein [Acetobacteraceae bacterium]
MSNQGLGQQVQQYVGTTGQLMGLQVPVTEPDSPNNLGKNLPANPGHQGITVGVTARVQGLDGFTLTHSAQELERLTAVGHALGLDARTIEDFLYISSRDKKQINAALLEQQMVNHATCILPRGYPYLFKNAQEFAAFSDLLVDEINAKGAGVAGTICVQGSSLRKPTAGDIDVAIILAPDDYAVLVRRYFTTSKKLCTKVGKKNGPVVVGLGAMNYVQLMVVCKDCEDNPEKYNTERNNFIYYMTSGILHSSRSVTGNLKAIIPILEKDYKKLSIDSISYVLEGSAFDLKPTMAVVHS